MNYITLGLSIEIRANKVKLSITNHIDDYLQHFGDHVSMTYATPMDPHITLSESMCPKVEVGMSDGDITTAKSTMVFIQMKPYRSMLGACSWITNTCHPDIVYTVHILQSYQSNPGLDHCWTALL